MPLPLEPQAAEELLADALSRSVRYEALPQPAPPASPAREGALATPEDSDHSNSGGSHGGAGGHNNNDAVAADAHVEVTTTSSSPAAAGGKQATAAAATAAPASATSGGDEDNNGGTPAAPGSPRSKLKLLGTGTFGYVMLARARDTKESVAIKFLPRSHLGSRYVAPEILNHAALRHPHIIQFREVFIAGDYLAIAMEYAQGGNLLRYVRNAGRLREREARWFFQQLVFAVDYSHRKGIASRDIKLDNCLLSDDKPLPRLMLADFGWVGAGGGGGRGWVRRVRVRAAVRACVGG